MLKDKNLKWVLLFLYIMLISALASIPKSFQNDIFYDIKIGEYIVNHGFFTNDPFSIHADLIYIPPHWLYDVIIYFIYNTFGFEGLHFFLFLWICFLFFLLYITFLKVSANKLLSLCSASIIIYNMYDFLAVRVQIFSYAIFIVEIFCIESFLKSGKKIWLVFLALLPVILINIHHGAWIFYFVIFLPYLANLVKIKFGRVESEYNPNTKQLLIPFLLGPVLSLFNPYGYESFLYTFKHLSENVLMYNIQEHLSPSFKSIYGVYYFLILSIVVLVYLVSTNKIRLHHFLMITGTIFMSLSSVRHFSLFLITSSVFVVEYISKLVSSLNIKIHDIIPKPSRAQTVLILFLLSLPSVNIISFNDYVDRNEYPVGIVDYISKDFDVSQMRLFNEYNFGSYLIFKNIKVFIDSRADLYTTIYNPGIEIAKDYFDCSKGRVYHREIFKKYNLNYALVRLNSPVGVALSNDPGFKEVHRDNNFILLKKISQ